LLLLEHTFGKKLCLHLCWDKNGFEDGRIERFWRDLEDAVKEFLMWCSGQISFIVLNCACV